jgi:hypothetical protein
MCFYNQKQFSCGDWSWTSFAHQCSYEYRVGETCGIKLVNKTETKSTKCCLCDRIETKYRRREAEEARLARWMREGAILVASMDRSRRIIKEVDRNIHFAVGTRAPEKLPFWNQKFLFKLLHSQSITVKAHIIQAFGQSSEALV